MKYLVTVRYAQTPVICRDVTVEVEAPSVGDARFFATAKVCQEHKWPVHHTVVQDTREVPSQKVARALDTRGFINLYVRPSGELQLGGIYVSRDVANEVAANKPWRLDCLAIVLPGYPQWPQHAKDSPLRHSQERALLQHWNRKP